MESDLFREQALEYQSASNSQFGTPTGVLPPSWSIITIFLTVFIVALFVFLFSVDFARKETVRGKLRVDGAEAKAYALESGVIKKVLVEEGQSITAGDPIAEISAERYMVSGAAYSEVSHEQLERERSALNRRRLAILRSSELSSAEANQRHANATRREVEQTAQLEVISRRLRLAQERASNAEEFLKEQLITEPQLNERLDAASSLQQMFLQTEAAINEAKADQLRAQLESEQVVAARDRELADIDQRIQQIDTQSNRVSAEASHIVRATIDGVVAGLQAREGEQTDPSVPLAVILPHDSLLIAEVYLPSRAIGFVEPGHMVKLQYDAFPYQKFGVAIGKIDYVSNAALMPNEIGLAAQSPEPVYRVVVSVESQYVVAFSKEVPLQPGMELSADIILENRRLIDWLLEPILSIQ